VFGSRHVWVPPRMPVKGFGNALVMPIY